MVEVMWQRIAIAALQDQVIGHVLQRLLLMVVIGSRRELTQIALMPKGRTEVVTMTFQPLASHVDVTVTQDPLTVVPDLLQVQTQ